MSHLLVSLRRTRGGLGECNRQYFFGGKFVCKGPFIIYGGWGGGGGGDKKLEEPEIFPDEEWRDCNSGKPNPGGT